MKSFKTKFRAGLAIASLFMMALALSASAQVTSSTLVTVTNQPAIVTTTATSNILSWVKISQGTSLALTWKFNQTSASTSNATLNVYTVVDGTNISTVPFAQLIAASTGTTDVTVNTNWNVNQLAGYNWLVIGNIANTTALTTLTNKLIIVRRIP